MTEQPKKKKKKSKMGEYADPSVDIDSDHPD